MRQAQKRKEKDKIAVVLMLCFCVIALTSIFTIKSNIDKINDSADDILVSEEAKASQTEETPSDDKSAKDSEASAKVPAVDSLDSSVKESPASYTYSCPIKGAEYKVTKDFSMDKLVYSLTLDQYMTHSGIDIQAPEDTQVLSIAEGTVTAVYNDDRHGISVEISHPGGIVAIYSNLSTDEMVEEGDVVNAGSIIGGVGSTGLFESMEPAHLHLEILKDGVYVNPKDYIKL